jgi:hypothetical protein
MPSPTKPADIPAATVASPSTELLQESRTSADNLAMGSNLAARVLMALAFVAASFGYSAWCASRTVLDPATTGHAANALFATPGVQQFLRDKLAPELERQLDASRNDPEIAAAIRDALRDPRSADAFEHAIVAVHQTLLADGSGPISLDLTDAMHDAIATRDPALAAQISDAAPVRVQIDSGQLPYLGNARDTAHLVATLGFAAAIGLGGASLILVRTRKAITKMGRRIAYLAIGPTLMFVVAPRLLGTWSNDGAHVGGVLIRSYASRVVPSVIALVGVGVAVVLAAVAWAPVAAVVNHAANRPSSSPPAPRPPDPRRYTAHDEPATEKLYL